MMSTARPLPLAPSPAKAPFPPAMDPMLRRLYDWTIELATQPWAVWALATVALVESSVFPIPPDIILIPMILAAKERAWLYATVCTVASVVGGYLGYFIGFALFDSIGQPILAAYHATERFESFAAAYNQWGAWIVAFFGVTPFPYKIITIASGATKLDPIVFGVASILSRGARFFLVAALLWHFGPPIRAWLERRLGLATILFFVLLLGGFLLIRLLA